MNGSIYGRVVDDLGAVLPGVTVRVCHLRTVVCNLTTDDCGCYQSPGLKPGWYDIVFWLSSEIPTWRSELAVLPGRRVEVEDFTLMPNGATERVTVFTRPTETCPRCLGEGTIGIGAGDNMMPSQCDYCGGSGRDATAGEGGK